MCMIKILILNIINLVINFNSSSLIFGLIAGEILILLMIIDYYLDSSVINLYRILLLYMYYYLVINNGYGNNDFIFYDDALIISIFFYIAFILGYNIDIKYIKYNFSYSNYYTKWILFIYLIWSLSMLMINIGDKKSGYSNQFLSFEEAKNINFYEVVYYQAVYFFEKLIFLSFGNPIYISIIDIFNSINSYAYSGIKGSLISGGVVFLLYFQYTKLYRIRYVNIILIIALFFTSILMIGSTNFRVNLGFESLIENILSIDNIRNGILSFTRSPESNHFRYLADIIYRIKIGEIDYRYGFDFYRFFLYPVKNSIINYEFASYVQYSIISTGENISQGFYLGLVGELFWNFGYIAIIFGFIVGYALKKYTNYCYSGGYLKFAVYVLTFKEVLWYLYRGQANTLIVYFLSIIPVIILINFLHVLIYKYYEKSIQK